MRDDGNCMITHKQEGSMSDRFYRVGEAAALIGVHRDTVQRWCRTGKLPAIRLPTWSNKAGQFRIRLSDVNAVAKRARPPT